MLKLELAGPMSDRIIYEDPDGKEHTLFVGTLNRDAPGFVELWQRAFDFNVAQDTAPPIERTPEEWLDIRTEYWRDEQDEMRWDDIVDRGAQ